MATIWTFASNLDITRPEGAAAGIPIGRTILEDLGPLGSEPPC
jgi:hypothetical protein